MNPQLSKCIYQKLPHTAVIVHIQQNMDLTCPIVFHATYKVNICSGLEVQYKLRIIQHLIQQTAHVTINKSFFIL